MNIVTARDGTAIAYDRVGDGPPVVIVAGAFCGRRAKTGIAHGLGADFTAFQYDRRGRGDSGAGGAYSVAREVEDLAAVIEAAGGEAFVFGDSSGGALAIEAAAVGVPVRRLAVYEVPYTAGPTSQFADHLDELVARGAPGDAAAEFLGLMGAPAPAIEGMRAGPHWAHMEAFAPTLSHDVRLCNEGEVPVERLAAVDVPVLALAGGASPWAGDVARRIAEAAPDGRAEVLEGQGHDVADDVLVPVLATFFA